MYARTPSGPTAAARFLLLVALLAATPRSVAAQTTAPAPPHQHEPAPDAGQPPHDMAAHAAHGGAMPAMRDASGTAWQPDDTPMYAVHGQAGGWMLMGHANAFVQYLRDAAPRGQEQAGSINWAMGMASRPLGGGRLDLHAMLSAEPWTIAGCGYPDLLASGEVCDGESIHDRQHPHDLWMELAASYSHPMARGVSWQVYGGPAGEPALGPVAFPHRLSALPNPIAPVTHHWFDSTHVTFGVVTGALYARQWKIESSLFNAREPDDQRADLDLAALDSWSVRAWLLPTPRWAIQISGGRLNAAEAGHDGNDRVDVDRITASATYHRSFGEGSTWASTIGWGRNVEEESGASAAFLAETALLRGDRHAWFGRLEISEKSGHDLDVDLEESAVVAKLQAGYSRQFAARRGWQPGIGGAASLSIVPASLSDVYGGRSIPGVAFFLTLRPSRSE